MFSELIIHILFRGVKLTDILLMVVMGWITEHPSFRLLLSEMVTQGTFKKHKSKKSFTNILYESAVKGDCSSRPFGLYFECLKHLCIHLTDLLSLWKTLQKFSTR